MVPCVHVNTDSNVHWTSHVVKGTRNTQPCITGPPVPWNIVEGWEENCDHQNNFGDPSLVGVQRPEKKIVRDFNSSVLGAYKNCPRKNMERWTVLVYTQPIITKNRQNHSDYKSGLQIWKRSGPVIWKILALIGWDGPRLFMILTRTILHAPIKLL